mgnify:CR=1 FL=1
MTISDVDFERELGLDSEAGPKETIDNTTAAKLRSYIERVERIQEEQAGLAEDAKELFNCAKGEGFDVPTMKAILRLRKQDKNERDEKESLLDLYKSAMGM